MKRDSFVFYRSFAKLYEIDNIVMRDRIMHALIFYALDGTIPDFTGIEKVLFEMMRPQIDANNKRYENGCKGAEHGKKGGRPKKQSALQCNDVVTTKPQENPTETPNVNVNVNVNDNQNVNDTTVVVSNAREVFCKTYAIIDDDTTADGIDFDVVSKGYSESKKFLQTYQAAKNMSWVITHYAEIIAGKYRDFEKSKADEPRKPSGKYHVEVDA